MTVTRRSNIIIQKIKKSILILINKIDLNDKPELYKQGWKLYSLLVQAKTSCGGLLITSLNTKTITKIQSLYNRWEWLVEEHFAKNVINKNTDRVDVFPLKHYHAISFAEVKYGEIDTDSYVYIIGSGIPITACLIDTYARPRKIICVEKDVYRAGLAARFVTALGKEDTISVIHAKGQQIDYPNATHIIFSALSIPKNELARHIGHIYSNKNINTVKILWRNTEIGNPDGKLFYPAALPISTFYKSKRIAQYFNYYSKEDIISTVVEMPVST